MFITPIFGAGQGYQIQRSLRFRAAGSAYLSRTPGSAGNRKTWTFSCWAKRGSLGSVQYLFSQGASATDYGALRFLANDTLEFVTAIANVIKCQKITIKVFRDPTAHYHIVVHFDAANTIARLYVNGVEQVYSTNTNPSNEDHPINQTTEHDIGTGLPYSKGNYFDGYLSEINFVDGQALTATDFGSFNTEGVWKPKKYVGIYGANGFYLPFSVGTNLATLTADRSGNGNNWTASGTSLTAGATYDWMIDTPTNNFAALNAIYPGKSTLTDANLTASGTTDLPTITPDYGTWYFEIAGVSQSWIPPAAFPSAAGSYNFGQRPWESTGPTGIQKTLCTNNLSSVTIVNPKEHFDVVLSTGANIKTATEAVFAANFLEWIKDRSNANNHQLIDIVRGVSAVLQSNTTAVETVYSTPAGNSVGWTWKAGGAPAVNNAGSIASQVSANVLAGFSVVSWAGNSVSGATIGHGLGVIPKLIITKSRNNASSWVVSLGSLTGFALSDYLALNSVNALANSSTFYQSFATDTFTVGVSAAAEMNKTGNNYISYCFAEIPDFSKISSYSGNGNTDGPFVWCGFRPRFLLIKRTNSTGDWQLVDAARSVGNVVSLELNPNLTAAESTVSSLDLLSNGFKLRSSDAGYNAAGGTYIFYAIAEHPFSAPANAR